MVHPDTTVGRLRSTATLALRWDVIGGDLRAKSCAPMRCNIPAENSKKAARPRGSSGVGRAVRTCRNVSFRPRHERFRFGQQEGAQFDVAGDHFANSARFSISATILRRSDVSFDRLNLSSSTWRVILISMSSSSTGSLSTASNPAAAASSNPATNPFLKASRSCRRCTIFGSMDAEGMSENKKRTHAATAVSASNDAKNTRGIPVSGTTTDSGVRRRDLDFGDRGQPGRDRAASPLLTSRSLFAFMAAFWPDGGSILVVRDVHRVGLVVGSLAAIRHRLDGFDHMPSYCPVPDRAKGSQEPEYLRGFLRLPFLRHDQPSAQAVNPSCHTYCCNPGEFRAGMRLGAMRCTPAK
ncbi:hypothetical protein AB7M49_005862 [Bradyrhizobium elkanii]